jgi:CheY-like chemotaxis protein
VVSIDTVPDAAPTILVVDDEPMIREAVTDHLRECGFVVMEACDAAEAIEIIEAISEIDIVFSDVRMPGMSGFQLAKWVLENRPGMPVFLASGYTGKMHTADDLCGAAFIHKPYSLSSISEQFWETIRARKDARPAE